jgi:hypothetical protein
MSPVVTFVMEISDEVHHTPITHLYVNQILYGFLNSGVIFLYVLVLCLINQ